MLFSKDFLFIHVPKTGGMSITSWLLNNYMGEMYLCVPEPGFKDAMSKFAFGDIKDRVHMITGRRHETLSQAKKVVERSGFSLEQFPLIGAVARHPLDLERSYYHHMRKPSVQARRREQYPDEAELLNGLGFPQFLSEFGFFGRFPAKIEAYFMIEGKMPENMKILRQETLQEDLDKTFGQYFEERFSLGRLNTSKNYEDGGKPTEVPPDLVQALQRKHPFLCELYDV